MKGPFYPIRSGKGDGIHHPYGIDNNVVREGSVTIHKMGQDFSDNEYNGDAAGDK